MKKKFVLDVLMTAVMISLLNMNVTGIKLHEILGIAVFFLFLVHKLFNLKWIKAVTKNLFSESVNQKTKLIYLIDVLLLVLVTFNVLTGILISTYILVDISVRDIALFSDFHHILAYSLLATLIVHVGMHWKFIQSAAKIERGGLAEKVTLGAVAIIIATALLGSDTVKRMLPPKKEQDSGYHTDSERSTDDADDGVSFENPATPDADRPTLEEYLSKLFCNRCQRRCLLTRPACGKGRSAQQEEVREYNRTYGTNETYESAETNKKPDKRH